MNDSALASIGLFEQVDRLKKHLEEVTEIKCVFYWSYFELYFCLSSLGD